MHLKKKIVIVFSTVTNNKSVIFYVFGYINGHRKNIIKIKKLYFVIFHQK